MGLVQRDYDWDWAAADASFHRALELEPGNAFALQQAGGVAIRIGRMGEAVTLTQKAIERDPLRPNAYSNLGFALQAAGRDAESEVAFRKALELDRDGALRHTALGTALLWQGKGEAALEEMRLEPDPAWRLYGEALAYHALGRARESDVALAALERQYSSDSAVQIAEVHAYRGQADGAFRWLERAYEQRDPGAAELRASRYFQSLSGDARYKALTEKLRLPDARPPT
jgi:Flp pilus assembly protein TadD